tara:strand:- start:471 stop:965 length:495 start_codon:yes stop_codon:yes gene_type:complete
MAIITTRYSLGWFGVSYTSGDSLCEPFNLTQQVGTYSLDKDTGIKTFVRGTALSSDVSEDDAKGLVVFGYTASGAPQVWTLQKEKDAFHSLTNPWVSEADRGNPNRGSFAFTKNDAGDAILACGRMYFIINNNNIEIDIPHFIPSADGVDMGRIDMTNQNIKQV